VPNSLDNDREALVEIAGASKVFVNGARKVVAIDNLSASIAMGQVTGLVGPDGAGKTTLIRLIAGLLKPDSGSIKVAGLDSIDDAHQTHEIMGYMPQRFGLYEDLSVIENLRLYADLRGVTGATRTQAFKRLLEFTGLAPFERRLAGKLSGGMKQKLGLACTLISRPKILLLDEPSVGVDPLSRRELWKMVAELVDDGIGVLWSTAYLDEAERCSTVLLLNEGKLLHDGTPQALTEGVKGRVFLLSGLSADKRQVQARAQLFPGVVDALIQGEAIRLVMGQDVPPPTPAALGAGEGAVIAPLAPRFEDAFLARLKAGAPTIAAAGKSIKFSLVENGHRSMVVADGLTRKFGDFTAVNNVSFEVLRGEIFGLLGPNGAGKSTTFKMLCGLLPPTTGLAQVAGINLANAPAEARARIGYMAQKFSLYGDLSVQQNLDFFSGIYGLKGLNRKQRVDEMIEIFGLGDYLQSNAGLLPLGFKQRLSLAAAIMHEPAILFLDEPTSGVDPLTRREFWGHINGMVQKGMTVLVTTHFLDEAEYCDRIALVYRASLIALGSPDALKHQISDGVSGEGVSGDGALAEHGGVTLEDAFIELIRRYDAKEGRG
jgi:ABC-2 type transport system ATP-binding protein